MLFVYLSILRSRLLWRTGAKMPCSLSKQSGDPARGAAEMKNEANRAEAH
jgi:hypothetical protein